MTSRLLALALLFAGTAAADPAPFVWIEAESPSESTPKVAPAGAAHPEWLSGGKWLFLNVEPKDQAAQLPKGEATFTLERPDVSVRSHAKGSFTATAEEFRYDIRLTVRDDGSVIHRNRWRGSVPRRLC